MTAMSLRQLAEHLDVPYNTLRSRVAREQVGAVGQRGRTLLFDPMAVDRAVAGPFRRARARRLTALDRCVNVRSGSESV